MMNHHFLSFFTCILCLVLMFGVGVNAVRPDTILYPSFETGFTLQIPPISFLIVGYPFLLDVHVFNSSDGIPVTTGVGCVVHLYNSTGSQLYASPVNVNPVDVYDFEFYIDGENFSEINEYSYIAQCNDSVSGGFANAELYVNKSGRDQDALASYLLALMFLPFLLSGVCLLFGWWLDQEHIVLKHGLFLFGLFFALASPILVMNVLGIMYPALTELLDNISWVTWVYATFATVVLFYYLLYATRVVINTMAQHEDDIR